MTQFCSFFEWSATQALFSGAGGLLLFLLICLTALFCIAAMWISPVSGAISSVEKQNRDSKTLSPLWFISLSAVSILILILSLYLTFFPYQCSKSASLISAAKPLGTTSWHDDLERFNQEFPRAKSCDQDWYCLEKVSNKILAELAASPYSAAAFDERALAKQIIAEVKGFADDPHRFASVCGRDCLNKLSPSLIESVELAVLMAWEAYTSTNNQRLGYFVSDRAHKYHWNWKGKESLFKSNAGDHSKLDVRLTPAQTTKPLLDLILSSALDGDKLSVTFTLVANDGGEIKLALVDANGRPMGLEQSLYLANQGIQPVLKTITFQLPDPSAAQQLSLLQTFPSKVRRALPRSRKNTVAVYIQGLASNKNEFSDTLESLASNTSCSAYSAHNYKTWHQAVGAYMAPDTVSVTHDIYISDVVIYLRQDGAMWVLPSHGIDPGLPLRSQQISWLNNNALSDANFINTQSVGDPVMVFDSSYDKGRAFSYDRLGLQIKGDLKLRIIDLLAAQSPPLLAARLENPDSLVRDSLGFSPWKKTLFSPLKVRLAVPTDDEEQSATMAASLFALNTQAMSLDCSAAQPIDQELFFAFWKSTFQDIYLATKPTVSLVTDKMDNFTGSPKIFIKSADLKEMKVERVKGKLILASLIFCFYISLMIVNIRRARD